MVAIRGSGTGLSPADLERVRDTLAAGRKPKVVFTKSAGQVAGQVGQIVALTDPDLSDEWVMVRFGRDELPFAPSDVSFAPRPSTRKAATVPNPREESPLSGVSKSAAPAADAQPAVSAAESAATDSPVPAGEATVVPAAPEPAQAESPAADSAAGAPAGSAKASEPAASGKTSAKASSGGRAARKSVKPKPPASLIVTLSYTDGEWLVSATQGVKTLAKPYLVRPAEALRMVSMLDVAGVRDAVDEIVTAAREEAQRKAEALRNELAEVEARLAELRDESE